MTEVERECRLAWMLAAYWWGKPVFDRLDFVVKICPWP